MDAFVWRFGAYQHSCKSSEVREVLSHMEAVRVPAAPHFVVGVAHLRGRVVPVIALHALLPQGVPSEATADRKPRYVVLDKFAFRADDVVGLSDAPARPLDVDAVIAQLGSH